MTSSKRGMTFSTCPARAPRPTPGPGRPGPGRRHQRVPVTTTAFRGCSMAFGLRLRPAGVRTGASYAAGARPPAPPAPRPAPVAPRPGRRRALPTPPPELGPKRLQRGSEIRPPPGSAGSPRCRASVFPLGTGTVCTVGCGRLNSRNQALGTSWSLIPQVFLEGLPGLWRGGVSPHFPMSKIPFVLFCR